MTEQSHEELTEEEQRERELAIANREKIRRTFRNIWRNYEKSKGITSLDPEPEPEGTQANETKSRNKPKTVKPLFGGW